MLVVGLPDSGVGGRSVRVFTADPSGAYVERLNITAPTNGPGGSRFGAQVTCIVLETPRSCNPPRASFQSLWHGASTGSLHVVPRTSVCSFCSLAPDGALG